MGRNGAPLSGRTVVPPVSTPVCLSAGPRCLAASLPSLCSPLPGEVRRQSPLSAVLPLSPASVLPALLHLPQLLGRVVEGGVDDARHREEA